MFPIGGSVGGGGGVTPPVVDPVLPSSVGYAMPMVKRAYASSTLGLGSGSLPLIQGASDLNKLYVINGISPSFESTLDGGTYWFTQVLLGNDSLAGVQGTFYVYINGATAYPVRFRVPTTDVIEHVYQSDVTEDFFDTVDRAAGTYVRIQRIQNRYNTQTAWRVDVLSLTDGNSVPYLQMDPATINTLPTA